MCPFWCNKSSKAFLYLVALRHYRATNSTEGLQPQHHEVDFGLTHKAEFPIVRVRKRKFLSTSLQVLGILRFLASLEMTDGAERRILTQPLWTWVLHFTGG
jgi:hypothetical protein